MKLSVLLNKEHNLRAVLILPVLGILAFTGCANLDGTAQNQDLHNHQVGTYMEQRQENDQLADSDADPGYEWFY